MTRGLDVAWCQIAEVRLIRCEHVDLFDLVVVGLHWMRYVHWQIERLAQTLANEVRTLSGIWAEAI